MSASNTNPTHITKGLQALSFTVARELRSIFGLDWWKTAAKNCQLIAVFGLKN